jgi:asparaginyl-tRNA synthetase
VLSYKQTYQLTNSVLTAMRKIIQEMGFAEMIPSIMTSRYEPGARHSLAVMGHQQSPDIMFSEQQIEVKGWKHYYLPVSHVVEKQMALEYVEKVYCLAPCIRLLVGNEHLSNRHLYNFFQFEIEWRTESMESVFETGESFLKKVGLLLKDLTESNELHDQAKRNISSLISGEYPKITFSEASKRIGRNKNSTQDFTAEDDIILTNQFDTPFWIYDYPEGVRDSIYHKNDRSNYDTYDLMLPFGYGELSTGGIRCKNSCDIIEQSKKLGKSYNPAYAEWKERTRIQTAGFGIGLERFLKFISGMENILEFVQYHDDGPNSMIDKSFLRKKTDMKQAA